jgi:hypothetical protein
MAPQAIEIAQNGLAIPSRALGKRIGQANSCKIRKSAMRTKKERIG